MMRYAKPGDIGIIVRDDFADGQNVGKQVDVKCQCHCESDQWECVALEVIRGAAGLLVSVLSGDPDIRCGGKVCCKKTSVIVKEDPDETPNEIVRELSTT
jgi:hypothetical protein